MKTGAIVLCGGKSTRMGRDKASLPFGPESMLQRVVRIVSQVVDPTAVVVVAAAEQALPLLPTSTIVARDERSERGPLQGLAAGLRSMPADVEAAYATSCDVPLIVPELITALFKRLRDHDIVVPVDGQFHHPLAAVYRTSVLAHVDALLSSDRLRPRFLFDECQTLEVEIGELRTIDPDLRSLMNLNHPEDYLAALVKAGLDE